MPSPIVDRVARLYAAFVGAAGCLRSPLLLAMRVYWGWRFHVTGTGKLHNLDGVTEYFRSLGIPAPGFNAAMAGTTECVGGLLLVLGLGSRLVSVPLAVTMLVAYATAHSESVRAFWADKGNVELQDAVLAQAPFLFLLTALVVLAFGPGAFSLDALIARMRGRKDAADGGAR